MPYLWPLGREELCKEGVERLREFCQLNGVMLPKVTSVSPESYYFDPCAYYRPEEGIIICLKKCQVPCGLEMSRNWSWPGNTTDREPFGVIAHELGHHCDWTVSGRKGRYYGDYGASTRERAKEPPISGYCPNDAEWFAEMFRVFVTNPNLLQLLRPQTYQLLTVRWKPLEVGNWRTALGSNVPPRIVRSLENKGVS